MLIPELALLGIDAEPAIWDDPAADWARFDAVVLRETWDYSDRRPEFLSWLRRASAVSLVLNPPDVVEWNTDKRYLRDLAAAGVPIVPTVFIEPGDDASAWQPPAGHADFVIKPAVSAGSRDTMRYAAEGPLADARAHVRRLLAAERTVMLQPYLDDVDTEGETALLFIGGAYSHAIRKAPLLVRGVEPRQVEGLFAAERIDPREPTDEQHSVARAVVAAVPGGLDQVLYARVDLIPAPDGTPQLLELELTEPSLFLSHAEGAPARLARALAGRLDRA